MTALVLTVDQLGSRSSADFVPEALAFVNSVVPGDSLPFERTVGDEFQGMLFAAQWMAPVCERLIRDGHWHIGIGVGDAEVGSHETVRSGAGLGFVRARAAVEAAKSSPWHLRVIGGSDDARDLESALWLWAAALSRRTARGWEVTDLIDEGLTYEQTGRRLGISQSAVSQRARSAGVIETRRARELVTRLAERCLTACDEE